MDGLSHVIALLLALGVASTGTTAPSVSTGTALTGTTLTGTVVSTVSTGTISTGATALGSTSLIIDARYDSSRVQQQWLERVNAERTIMKRTAYQGDDRLNTTAQARADFLRDTNQIQNILMHDRTPAVISKADGIRNYNYTEMLNRFAGYNVRFSSKGTAFSEIVGRGFVSCASNLSREQCTQRVIDATKTTMDFFMKEKRLNGVHYRSLVNSSFDRMGVGVAINWKTGRYRFVGHVSGPIVE